MKGLSLIELISTIAIVSIMTGLVFPSFAALKIRSEATTGINWIVTAVNFTRHAAIMRGTTMTLCPTVDGRTCRGPWHQGVMIFADHNQDAKLNGQDYILQIISEPKLSGTLKWRAFRNRQFLQMTAMGYTNYQNGNFVYCPANGDLRYARQIVINLQGRARLVHSRNEADHYIDRYGRPLRC